MDNTGAVIISGIAAAVAFWGVMTQRAIARRRATLDMLTASEADGDLIRARKKFIELAKHGGLAQYAVDSKEDSDETQAIRIVLNEFELLAIGIQRGIIDYQLYLRWNRSATIKYWSHAIPFVHDLRARLNNPKIYQEFEVLVGWLQKGSMPKRFYWWGQFFSELCTLQT